MTNDPLSSTQAASADVGNPQTILVHAAQRATAKGLDYFGEVTPAEAWALHQAGAATLIDVRTQPEWAYVGHIDAVPLVPWRAYGAEQTNPDFLTQVGRHAPTDKPVMFLCRSGVRSHSAASVATAAGYGRAINILEGFEGDLDDRKQRGSKGGWRAAGLPWVQS
jgi:rhodanese-related sulfurtransferase